MIDEPNDIRSHIERIARPISLAEISDGHAPSGAPLRPARFRVAMAAAVVVLVAGFAALLVASNRDQDTQLSGESALPGAPSTDAVDVAETQPAESLPAPKPFADEFSARGVLAEVPTAGLTDADFLIVSGTDFEQISELTGVERTGGFDIQEPPTAWLRALFLDGTVAVADSQRLVNAGQNSDEFEQEIGFSFIDVDRFVSVTNYLGLGGDPQDAFPFDVVVLRSGIDPLVASAGDDRIIDIGSGADGERFSEERTPIRPIGRPLRVAVNGPDSTVAISGSTPFVESWLGTDATTLAEEPDLVAAAEALDRVESLYSVRFEQLDRDLDNIEPEFRAERPDDDFRIVEEFAVIGVGSSGIGESERTTFVYVFADDAAAVASVAPITQLYGPGPDATAFDSTEVEGAETVPDVFVLDDVRAEGRTVVVTGQTTAAADPQDLTKLSAGLGPLSVHR